ncbi:MAG: SUMF1/EgtB/PvdO family nonheme iron enzyme [Verrucomicrobia bacterium]|nr:SUMF1/EgtB/PvdO family nonheme iron enzyme [Verrucomicrobiota bacterium]
MYDMHGNVCEWCLDHCNWDNDNRKIVADTYEDGIKDPLCTTGSLRIIRGGYWEHHANVCRSAVRGYSTPDNRSNNLGFRVALAPVQ